MSSVNLARLRAGGRISALDEHFARAIGRAAERLGGEPRPEVLAAAALVSARVGDGDVCLDVRALESLSGGDPAQQDSAAPGAAWTQALRASPVVGDGSAPTPLVLDADGRLYLQRYWQHEQRLAAALLHRARDRGEVDPAWLGPELDRLLPGGAASPDWQRVATSAALDRSLCVIAGGPGTGKTATVVKILALAIARAQRTGAARPRMALVAPTGKAAARLVESIRRAKVALAAPAEVISQIPEEASTIHRCLGYGRGGWRYDGEHPLAIDLVLVDEASMVDLALMAHLVAALPADAKLILLGDADQLASVDAGAVFGDICDTGRQHPFSRPWAERLGELCGEPVPGSDAMTTPGIWDCVVRLQHSYRYDRSGGIGALAAAINAGDGERALDLLRGTEHPELEWIEPGAPSRLGEVLRERAVAGFAPSVAAGVCAADRLRALERFRVLCAVRHGPRGVTALNRDIETALAAAGLVDPADVNYAGRAVMITRNDYGLGLFNGDVGMYLREAEPAPGGAGPSTGVRAAFSSVGGVRWVSRARLPSHETVFAMTVHKSQGSELDDLLLVLPERDVPVLTRELIYTAVTRARTGVAVFGDATTLRAAIARRTTRPSGLRAALWRGFDEANQKP